MTAFLGLQKAPERVNSDNHGTSMKTQEDTGHNRTLGTSAAAFSMT